VAAPELEGFAKAGGSRIIDGGIPEDAIAEVLFEDEQAGGFEARTHREELGEDVFATALVFEHVAQSANLALDAGQAVEQALGFFGSHRLPPGY